MIISFTTYNNLCENITHLSLYVSKWHQSHLCEKYCHLPNTLYILNKITCLCYHELNFILTCYINALET